MQTSAFLLLVNVSPTDWCAKVDGVRRMIGRSPDAQVRIPEQYTRVSRRHAEIWTEGRKFWLRDLQSRGGTQVNGVWISADRPVEVEIGDRLTLTDAHLVLLTDVPALAAVLAETSFYGTQPAGGEGETVSIPDFESLAMRAQIVRSKLECLTPAELDVVLWMCRGFTDDGELGGLLHRSPHTVRTQVGSILQKLELRSRISILNWLKKGSSPTRKSPAADIPTRHEFDRPENLGNTDGTNP
jgi:DNA-binding CsgD family transcriptional regulator